MDCRSFSYKDAHYRIRAPYPEIISAEIVRLRNELEAYIVEYPLFQTSLEPVPLRAGAPALALAMHEASATVGVGPMAAVAGAIAEEVVRKARRSWQSAAPLPGTELPPGALVENGGDIFLWMPQEVVIGLYAGGSSLSGRIGLAVPPEIMPLAVCSSSGTMGHALSFGRADLATAVASSGALADAAATLAGNLIQSEKDIPAALDRVCSIPGIRGALIVVGEKVGIQGDLPPLVPVRDQSFTAKITRDRRSDFLF